MLYLNIYISPMNIQKGNIGHKSQDIMDRSSSSVYFIWELIFPETVMTQDFIMQSRGSI